MYKQENRARIEAEPIEITLGEVTLPLEHIDRNRDQPSQWGSFKEAIDKSKTPEDWENIVRLLEGYNSAGVRWRSAKNFEILIRRMSLANMHHLLLKAIQRSRHTGLRLRSFPVILSLFRELHATAAVSGFETEKIERMLRFAEQYVELLEDRQHCGSRDAAPMDPRTSPYIIAIPAALAAAKAKKTSQGNDKVRLYASRLMEALQQSHNEVGRPRLIILTVVY